MEDIFLPQNGFVGVASASAELTTVLAVWNDNGEDASVDTTAVGKTCSTFSSLRYQFELIFNRNTFELLKTNSNFI